jgi:hypothetical protein
MALIDVDRHILSEIVTLHERIRKDLREFDKHWSDIIQVRDKTDALLFTTGVNDANLGELKRLRDVIFTASFEALLNIGAVKDAVSQQQALLRHMVTHVQKADTNIGSESNPNP